MYGLVNQAVEELITERFGVAAWTTIKQRAGVTDEMFLSMQSYPDAVTYQLVAAASETLKLPADQLLEAFGEYWTLYTGSRGYGELFQRAGRTFREFMLNLQDLHSNVAVGFPALAPPSFWCTDVAEDRLRLHYQSTRPGLSPMVIGLVRGLGTMFAVHVTVAHVVRRDDGADHDEFDVTFEPLAPTVP